MNSSIDSSSQAWLFAMTSGLASALGGKFCAAIYLDPLLHALGVSRSFNLLESHTVLSALLSAASGIMAYTSISVLTKESMDYLSKLSERSWLGRYPGATTAVLFVIGAHLNLLLVRLVSRIMPSDSPIKHACASHPPSPSGSQLESGSGLGLDSRRQSPTRHSSGASSSSGADYCPPHTHSHGGNGLDRIVHSSGSSSRGSSDERLPLLSQFANNPISTKHTMAADSSTHVHPKTDYPAPCRRHSSGRCEHGAAGGSGSRLELAVCRRCEYACAEPECYRLEHCHITPLYPHMHTHDHASTSAPAHPSGSCCRGVATLPGPDPRHCRRSHQHGHSHSPADLSSGEISETAMAHSPSTMLHNFSHEHAHEHGARAHVAQLEGPKTDTAAQISSRHHRLLIHVGLQTAVAIALHKVPEGLIIYLSRQASPRLGVSVAASLFFHNLPEGLMLALPLFLATRRRHMAFLVSSLMGAAPPALGAALGMLVLGHDDSRRDRNARLSGTFGVAFGITAGMMCMVALNGMLPTARIYDKSGNVVSWCFALGVAAMVFANSTL